MDVIAGLPAHVLLVHGIVVLAPLTAVLEILCALWPAARRRLVWLVLALAAVTTALTPPTTKAGEWLLQRQSAPTEMLRTHAQRGDWMIVFSVALLVGALALAVLHWIEGRSDQRRVGARIAVAALTLVVGVSATVGVVRIGDSGARAVWEGVVSQSAAP